MYALINILHNFQHNMLLIAYMSSKVIGNYNAIGNQKMIYWELFIILSGIRFNSLMSSQEHSLQT
jgi:hypothetical protein